ncbi:thioesterase family protein [Bacillus sp. DTU_2020_1000418_1_SI_GHA_SEK_038]|uniref:acyl-CoA thioesterase n=1 Tax=Bacillus sp. DTU_2020_1000418_1_SI_GHA_SEK_038 TaxID=3077585 RepID=UPI0028EA2E27|nr:thioesterase family protein [Bacillus sp. DTU_2020_1000418_1_SI_GHA_SEK_038]WNS74514.1 thioesterase family protein [Bacillus sp. DTU_2020_1000418_1_SI_GHA_SEK_038]
MNRISYIKDFPSWEEGFEFFHPVKVRFSETDMFGHLNNTVPFTYFEVARIEFFKNIGFMQDWVNPKNETIPVVADLQCDFLKQVFFDEHIKVYVKAASIGTSSVDLHYMGKKEDGSVCFTGRGTMVQISKKTGKGYPWTEEMKTLLLNHVMKLIK